MLLFIAQALLVIALVIGVVATWWWFPRWQLRKFYADITDAADQADAEDKFRRTLSRIAQVTHL